MNLLPDYETILIPHYRKFQALYNIDLQIEMGLFGLLGPNGAEKSTLMKIPSTIPPLKDGEVIIYDFNLQTEGDSLYYIEDGKLFLHNQIDEVLEQIQEI